MNQNADAPLETDCRPWPEKLARGGQFVLVDCREQDEFDLVHIDGAVLIPMSQLADRVGRTCSLPRLGSGHPLPSRRPQPARGQVAARARVSPRLKAWPAESISGPSKSIPVCTAIERPHAAARGSSCHSTAAIALKEWAAVCEALAAGRQTILLRKGGIAEGPGGFRPEHSEFWLLPTWFHAAARGTQARRPAFFRVVRRSAPADRVRINCLPAWSR